MTLHLSWPLAASLLVLLLGGRASAQTQAFSAGFEVWVDGERLINAPVVYIAPAQCAQGVEFALTVRGFSTVGDSISTLEFWASPSPGVNCGQAANRVQNTTSITPCWLIGQVPSVTTTARLSIDAQDIFWPDPRGDLDTCAAHVRAVTIFAIPLSSPSANNPSNPPEPITGVPVHKATLTLGSEPSAPTRLKGVGGERELQVAWAKPADARAGSTYTVYWDTGVGTDASCSDSLLREG
jgi:hypothetical protein